MSSVSVPRSRTGFLHGAWTPEDSERLYGVPDWGQGYVGINREGHVVLRPDKKADRAIDLFELVEGLRARGLHTPLLLRFSDVLRHRLQMLKSAFDAAIEQESYKGGYCCVYPIKVNQQRSVVEEVRDVGSGLGFGLEAGSKPELLAVLGLTVDHPQMPIVCNGFKDAEYVEMVILATKLGRRIIPVVEKFSELELIVAMAKRYDVRPSIGVRVKLASRGQGRWESSGGVRSKFGLFISEILDAARYLEQHGMLDCLNLVHAHIGSQICDIRRLKNAINELAYVYVGLRQMGADVNMIDVGGGLAVDYDGSQTAFDSSMNYTIQEYANDVV
ncbi:MAG: biosynthetic arginine decarboxylase, partial [Phycisphaerales bacterium]|nr:biosynthetic arginine decarboxylase [Phycisphaerales bacterium]